MSEVVFDQLIYCFDRSYRDSKLFVYSFYDAWENFPKNSHGTARGKISKKSSQVRNFFLSGQSLTKPAILKLQGTLIFLKSQKDFSKVKKLLSEYFACNQLIKFYKKYFRFDSRLERLLDLWSSQFFSLKKYFAGG